MMARLSMNAIIARKALDMSVNELELAKEVANVFDRSENQHIMIEEILEWDLADETKKKMYEDIFFGWMKGWKLE